jgi:hypothetical protein
MKVYSSLWRWEERADGKEESRWEGREQMRRKRADGKEESRWEGREQMRRKRADGKEESRWKGREQIGREKPIEKMGGTQAILRVD